MDQIQLEQIVSEIRKSIKDSDSKFEPALSIITEKIARMDERTINMQANLANLSQFRDEAAPMFSEFHEYKRLREDLPKRIDALEKEQTDKIAQVNKERSAEIAAVKQSVSENCIKFEYNYAALEKLDIDNRLAALEKTNQKVQGGIAVVIAIQVLIGLFLAYSSHMVK